VIAIVGVESGAQAEIRSCWRKPGTEAARRCRGSACVGTWVRTDRVPSRGCC